MSDRIFVDTDRMNVILPQVQELVEKIRGATSALENMLAPLDGAAGVNDATAREFYGSYTPTSTQIEESLQQLAGIGDGIVTGIKTMIKGYTETEEGNTVPANLGGDSGSGSPASPKRRPGSGK